jgi:hypothetical protein
MVSMKRPAVVMAAAAWSAVIGAAVGEPRGPGKSGG